ncbi:MAG: LAGLIDADG family homing endonuclease [Candidatus Omnitrophota bacterium]|jgi:intein/homing endonuclease
MGICAQTVNPKLVSAGRSGAFKRNSLYGNPATREGRIKGGINAILAIKNNPRTNFTIAKEFVKPIRSSELAEFLGIVLGDGSVSDYQVKIYCNSMHDYDYALFIRTLINNTLGLDVAIHNRVKNTLELVVSSVKLVKFLNDQGIYSGNKILNKSVVPGWVKTSCDYMKSCLRGLMDTDGSIYFHNHVTKGYQYRNPVLCFTSHSEAILHSVNEIFSDLGFNVKNSRAQDRIFIYNCDEIIKYRDLIGSSNPYFLNRLKSF